MKKRFIHNLTKKEVLVGAFWESGVARKEIAETLKMSASSVYFHICNLKKKGGLKYCLEQHRKTEQLRKSKLKKDKQNAYVKKRMKTDAYFRLRSDMSSAIHQALLSRGTSKNGNSWLRFVDYTVRELKEHLEKRFKPGMTRENRGEWHIDHIIPNSYFNYSSPQDEDFKRCWALNNLQPLWAVENLLKGSKINVKDLHKFNSYYRT